MKIYLASDHAGFNLKEVLKKFLADLDYETKDFGAFEYNEKDDYPDFIREVAMAVANDPERSRGLVLGMSGQGEAMAANRFKNVRAAVYYGGASEIIKLSREHNNANILSLGARFLSEEEAKNAVKLWLETKFIGEERHVRRLGKMDKGYKT